MDRLTKPCENTENGKYIPYVTGYFTGIYPDCTLGKVVSRLAEYENTGLTPSDIEQMKVRMSLPPTCIECKNWTHEHLWIGYKFCPYCGRELDELRGK